MSGMGMGMGMGMSMNLSQSMKMTQSVSISIPATNWSLVKAWEHDAEQGFNFPLTLKRHVMSGFEEMSHEERMKALDEANKVFRFHYARGRDRRSGKEKWYYKVPLLRDRNIMNDEQKLEEITTRISRDEYERATAVLEHVGEMERIARAIPYYGLLTTVRKHLKQVYRIGEEQAVIVGVDRGGRLPAMVLTRALSHPTCFFLKVDQGGGQLDTDRLEEFAATKALHGKHVIFVDSTVDSGRQIGVLQRYFDDPSLKERLGYTDWCIVGSNEYAKTLDKHLNINWGVDPDTTFEDDPRLMGVDYAPGTNTKVVEVPSATSEKIRQVIFDVPNGYILDLSDVTEQIATIRQRRKDEDTERKLYEKVEKERDRLVRLPAWGNTQRTTSASLEPTSVAIPATPPTLHNILLIGNGSSVEMSERTVHFLADTLGTRHSFFAGTLDGNPGAVMKTVCDRVPKPEVRLYQPEHSKNGGNGTFGGVPVVYIGPEKEDMRRRMVKDSHFVLALGGREGTLREVLLALAFGRPTFLVKGWGAIPDFLLKQRRYAKMPNLHACKDIGEAVQSILDAIPKV